MSIHIIKLQQLIKEKKEIAAYLAGGKKGAWGLTTDADRKRGEEIQELERQLSQLQSKSSIVNNPNYTETRKQLDAARKSLELTKAKYDKKKKELMKAVQDDTPDLFGERKSHQASLLFHEPVNMNAISPVLRSLSIEIDVWQKEVEKLEKILLRIESIDLPDLFEQTA
jgi:hypothetical protein